MYNRNIASRIFLGLVAACSIIQVANTQIWESLSDPPTTSTTTTTTTTTTASPQQVWPSLNDPFTSVTLFSGIPNEGTSFPSEPTIPARPAISPEPSDPDLSPTSEAPTPSPPPKTTPSPSRTSEAPIPSPPPKTTPSPSPKTTLSLSSTTDPTTNTGSDEITTTTTTSTTTTVTTRATTRVTAPPRTTTTTSNTVTNLSPSITITTPLDSSTTSIDLTATRSTTAQSTTIPETTFLTTVPETTTRSRTPTQSSAITSPTLTPTRSLTTESTTTDSTSSVPFTSSLTSPSPSPSISPSSTLSLVPSPTPTQNVTSPIAPPVTYRMAYASNGKQFFIQGGDTGNGSVAMFYSLDLSKSWSTTSALWSYLPPAAFSGSAASLDSKGRFLMTSGGDHISIFENSSWHLIGTDRKLEAKGPVITSCSNNVWFFGSGEGFSISESELSPNPTKNMTLPPNTNKKLTLTDGYAVASAYKDSVLRTSPNAAGAIDIEQFSTSSYEWTRLNTSGSSISQRSGHCFVPSIDGSKLYFFGGQTNVSETETKVYGELYEFTRETNVWKQLDSTNPRSYMACAAATNAFVVWGGRTENDKAASVSPMVFDFRTNKWVDYFYGIEDSTNTPTPGSKTLTRGEYVAIAVAGVIAVMIITAATVYCFVRHHRSKLSTTQGSRTNSLYSTTSEGSGLLGRSYQRSLSSLGVDSTLGLEVKESDMRNNPQVVGLLGSSEYEPSEMDALTEIHYIQ
ncbi:hypothetical protein BGZ76_004150 [Entomortierella beljakovae]|nr:hypothetical protein BGZ76_004150 [Entomortierella beljakovae]